MITRFFLGANSGAGFYSLYDGFAAGGGDFLWVIKGGPGGGKSGFMRRIGALAEKSGLDVEYILCSGDPASLDGVYIPALKTGWADGTAPHILEPRLFGGAGAYLDLGRFCDAAAMRRERGELQAVTDAYRAKYQGAYRLLRAAAAVAPEKRSGLVLESERAAVRKRARSAASRLLPRAGERPGAAARRFLSAHSCDGGIFLGDTVSALCREIYLLDDRFGLGREYLTEMAAQARSRGVDSLLCPDPLDPSEPEALLLPGLSLGFVARAGAESELSGLIHRLRLDAAVDSDRIRELRPGLRADERIKRELLDAAYRGLAEAKALHDSLERIYNPYVDFASVRAQADKAFRAALDA